MPQVHTVSQEISGVNMAILINIPSKKVDLVEVGVKPGWFLRAGCCTIWFEIEAVYSSGVVAASRDLGIRIHLITHSHLT